MREYQLVNLADLALVGDPIPLPPEFANLSDAVVSDFSAYIDPPPVGYAGRGLFPLVVTPSVLDPATEADTGVVDLATRAADRTARVVRARSSKRALTPEELAAARDTLYAYAANARYEREVGGMVIGGMPVAIDDRSKLLLAGARIKAEADPSYTTRWKVSNTERVDIPAAQIVAMSDAVLAWVDRTFDAYDKVADLIAAGTARTPAAIDAAFTAELA